MTQEMVNSIAEEYLSAKHEPNHSSYAAFVAETWEQFQGLVRDGWDFSLTDTNLEHTPYVSSEAMFRHIASQRLIIYSGGSNFAPGHPLKYQAGDTQFTMNEVFRAVHDVLGHGLTLCPFETLDGEIEAYRNHKAQYSPAAHAALFGETIGQLAHYYSGRGFVEVQECKIITVREV